VFEKIELNDMELVCKGLISLAVAMLHCSAFYVFFDAYLPGAPLRATEGTVIAGGGTGTGNGSDVTIKYPANQRQYVNMRAVLPGSGPGETLIP
jgi:hypothetical protein